MPARFNSYERQEIVDKSRQCLWEKSGEVGLNYLREQRKLSDEIIHRFSLGYLPDFVKHNNPNVPQISGRIIMPIYDPSNNLIAVSARALVAGGSLPLYWHEAYEKSFYLYGLNLAIDTIRKWRFAVIVEGQIDVAQMHNHGITNTVGVCSTNLSDIQISILHRYCEEFILMFDYDRNFSGQKGTEKVMKKTIVSLAGFQPQSLYRNGYKFESVSLSGPNQDEFYDPDEFLKKFGSNAMKSLIKMKIQKLRENDAD